MCKMILEWLKDPGNESDENESERCKRLKPTNDDRARKGLKPIECVMYAELQTSSLCPQRI